MNDKLEELKAEVIMADAARKAAETKTYNAKKAYFAAKNKYSNAVALEVYGFKIGDVIEFTEVSPWSRKAVVKRIKITGFSAFVRDDFPWTDTNPSIMGTIVRKNGTLGTRTDTCFPGSDKYRDIKKIEESPAQV